MLNNNAASVFLKIKFLKNFNKIIDTIKFTAIEFKNIKLTDNKLINRITDCFEGVNYILKNSADKLAISKMRLLNVT